MSDLLIELFSEEIPARMQRKAAGDFKDLVLAAFKDAGLSFGTAQEYWTPRRLVLSVTGLPAKTEDQREERKGPKEGAPEKALQGFLRGAGLSSIDQAELRDTGKGKAYFAVIDKPGQAAKDILPAIITDSIGKLPWPKSMRWARNTFRWVRPLHSIVAILDGQALEGSYEGFEFGNQTQGHRFMAPGAFEVSDFADFKAKLKDHYVVLDQDERKALVKAGCEKVAADAGLSMIEDAGLMEEVTNLVEWPVPVLGSFAESFLDVPAECLILSMKEHQKYFALRKTDGSLANAFITMANIETPDQGAAIRHGNERVLNARLSDAEFFWQQDKKTKLEDRCAKLGNIVFHAKMGSVLDKTQEVAALARLLAASIPGCDADQAQRAVDLSKADLVTDMVGEFPELQGLMGRYYAQIDGEEAAVAQAIEEHYSPLGPNDACPTEPVSVAAALADKLWILMAFWKIDEKPTGSKDPFALRRAALGAIRLILENKLRLSLRDVLAQTVPDQTDDLLSFMMDRLKVMLRDKGIAYDTIDAAFALEPQADLTRLVARIEAIDAFRKTDAGSNLLAAYKRGANILKAEEKKADVPTAGTAVSADLLEAAEEIALQSALETQTPAAATALQSEGFEDAMAALSSLRDPVDAFFDKVVVNADDPAVRMNRLSLLMRMQAGMDQVADFSKLEG